MKRIFKRDKTTTSDYVQVILLIVFVIGMCCLQYYL